MMCLHRQLVAMEKSVSSSCGVMLMTHYSLDYDTKPRIRLWNMLINHNHAFSSLDSHFFLASSMSHLDLLIREAPLKAIAV